MNVNPKRCKTCPFNAGGNREIRAKVVNLVVNKLSCSQYCHGTDNATLCRGARDEQLKKLHQLGYLPEPTDRWFEIISKSLGVKPNNQRKGPSYGPLEKNPS